MKYIRLLKIGWKVWKRVDTSNEREQLYRDLLRMLDDGEVSADEWAKLGRDLGLIESTSADTSAAS